MSDRLVYLTPAAVLDAGVAVAEVGLGVSGRQEPVVELVEGRVAVRGRGGEKRGGEDARANGRARRFAGEGEGESCRRRRRDGARVSLRVCARAGAGVS